VAERCVEWITLAPGARAQIYTTAPLSVRNERMRLAVVFVHGGRRDAEVHFSTGIAASLLAGTSDDTLVIAPRFAALEGDCRDEVVTGEIKAVRRSECNDL
jgi:hypothetical protein